MEPKSKISQIRKRLKTDMLRSSAITQRLQGTLHLKIHQSYMYFHTHLCFTPPMRAAILEFRHNACFENTQTTELPKDEKLWQDLKLV